jgi:hypothetical protein
LEVLDGGFGEEAADCPLVEGMSDGEVALGGVDEESGEDAEVGGGVVAGCAEAEEGLGAGVADYVVGFFDLFF